jgi:hypothetical protein
MWSISDHPEASSMLQPNASSSGAWKDSSLKEYGLFVKQLIKKYNL